MSFSKIGALKGILYERAYSKLRLHLYRQTLRHTKVQSVYYVTERVKWVKLKVVLKCR